MTREDEIRARLDAATRGPWVSVFGSARHDDYDEPFVFTHHDSDFIANCPTDVAYLHAENARLRAALRESDGSPRHRPDVAVKLDPPPAS